MSRADLIDTDPITLTEASQIVLRGVVSVNLHGEFWLGNRDRVYSHPSSPDFQRAASEAIRRA